MESKWWFAILFLVIIFVGLVALLFVSPLQSPKEYDFETCNVLKDSGGAHNIVFISDETSSKEWMEYFLAQRPYNSYKDSFNFYYIDSFEPECELYKGIAFLCYSRDLIKKASVCPNDIIVVLKEGESSIRSSAYMNVVSLNVNLPKSVFIHEFAHVFANLADEYIPASIPRGSENCQTNCKEFEECFEGCSKNNFYRSIEKGVMRTLSSTTYGEFNEKLILEEIVPNNQITGSVIKEQKNCEEEEYYLIQGSYENGLKILSKSLERGCFGGNGAGDYNVQLIKNSGEKIFEEDFNPELIFTDTQTGEIIDGGTFESDKDFYLKIPKIDDTKKVEIILDGDILASENLYDTGRRPCKK
jgi:hypothetical protein